MADVFSHDAEHTVVGPDVIDVCTRGPKSSIYAEAADPAKYRVKDSALFACAAHTDAAVLCTTAGKTGRNGRTAAVGPTIIWLTCPHINNIVARIERYGGVQAAAHCLCEHEPLLQRHVASHAVYLDRAKALLDADQWHFFHEHFAAPTDRAAQKFGNAAVCHAGDLKCLHALVAQSLGGAPNPLGDAVVNYIRFCHLLIKSIPVDSDEEAKGKKDALRSLMNAGALFDHFLNQTIAVGAEVDGDALTIDVPPGENNTFIFGGEGVAVPFAWISSVQRLADLQPDLCTQCLEISVFVDGKRPTTRRKHRLN